MRGVIKSGPATLTAFKSLQCRPSTQGCLKPPRGRVTDSLTDDDFTGICNAAKPPLQSLCCCLVCHRSALSLCLVAASLLLHETCHHLELSWITNASSSGTGHEGHKQLDRVLLVQANKERPRSKHVAVRSHGVLCCRTRLSISSPQQRAMSLQILHPPTRSATSAGLFG